MVCSERKSRAAGWKVLTNKLGFAMSVPWKANIWLSQHRYFSHLTKLITYKAFLKLHAI